MKVKQLIGPVLCLAMLVMFGCGGGGGAGSDPNAPASLTLIPSKTVALASGSDAVTIQADVRKGDNTPVADGTTVDFVVTAGTGTLSAATAVTTNGLASATLTSGVSNQTVTVRGNAGSASGETGVKFINQPSKVDVFIGFNQAVTNLAGLDFRLLNTAGATFDNGDPNAIPPRTQLISPIGAGGTTSLVTGNFDAAANSNRIALISAAGFNTGTTPFIKATYAVSTGLPTFSADLTPANFSAIEPNGGAVTPAVTAANIVVTVTYDTE